MSIRTSSSFSADGTKAARAFRSAGPGDSVAGFRLERLIGRGETGAVFEATQVSLGRAVALRLIDPARYEGPDARARLERELSVASSLGHPGLVPVFEAGDWAGGKFVAMRLVRGATLASLPPPDGPDQMLEPVEAGLEAAHRAGISHGAVRAENVFVDRDGRASLADLGLGRGRGAEADLDGLAGLRSAAGAPRRHSRRRRMIAAGGAAVAAAALVAALLLGGGSAEERAYAEDPAPPAPAGTEPLASSLEPGAAEQVGCGQGFGSASLCRLLPAGADGAALRVREAGLIRSWAVRGATGELTLEVLRRQGAAIQRAGFSQPVTVPDPGPHRFPAAIAVARGDLIAVKLSPGSAVGLRRGRGAALRLAGTVLPLPPRPRGRRVEGELLLRVDIEPAARPPAPAQVTGPRARGLPPGTTLARTIVGIGDSRAFEVRLVRASGGIRLDSLEGRRRVAGVPIADADPAGELVLFEQTCGHPRSVCVRWRNAEEPTPLLHEFRVTRSGRLQVIG